MKIVLFSVLVPLVSAVLQFQVSSGGNDNFLYRDNVTSAQVLLTSQNNTATTAKRLVFALPAGNSGALAYFLPSSASLNLSLLSLTSTVEEFDNAGVQADVKFNANATLGVTIIGAVRAMRDFVEGGGSMNKIFNYTLDSYNSTSIRLHRQNINTTEPGSSVYKGSDLYISIPPDSEGLLSVTPSTDTTVSPQIDFIVPDNTPDVVFRFRFLTNETGLTGLDTPSLFLPPSRGTTPGIQTALQGLADGSNQVAQQVSFLTYSDRFLAGGWRFLTYFGRDSMIALRILMPLMTPEAIEAALGAVIERANSTGALCHEETVGDYASFININNGHPELGNKPFYDYKMIDTDLLLLPALSHYFLDLPQGEGRAKSFLAKTATLQEGTYGQILERIASYNFNRALPFYQDPKYQNLLAFRPGQPVGDWRDSNEGTGFGPIPFDVNTALVPASLRATERLIDAGTLQRTTIAVGAVAAVWETKALPFFEVNLDASTAEKSLNSFVENPSTGLSSSVLNGNGSVGNVSFYALSLRQDGSPVQVMHSDLGFGLLYGNNLPAEFLKRVVDALTDYPRGLLTNIGMVVANPAYDTTNTLINVLDRAAYHGTVIWSFQQGLMAGGLERQLGFCESNRTSAVDINPTPNPPPSWCSDTALLQSLRDAQERLWASIQGAQPEIYSEVWSYSYDASANSFSVADLVSLSGSVESDAIQLWSYGFLGLLNPEALID